MTCRIPLLTGAVAAVLIPLSTHFFDAPALAQAPCPYATLRLESAQPVDPGAICEAARPLAEKGLRILVYLTDQRTNSEEAWFELIDAVEAAEGFRDPNQGDIYARTGITLAASTNTSTLWGINATFGERLFDSRADRQFDQIRTQIRPFLAAGQPTQAMVTGLTTIYAFNFPPSPLRTLLPIGAAGLAGGGGWLVWNRKKKRQRLVEQITQLQKLVSTLMLACDELVPKGDPTQAMYYQLFAVMGGEEAKGLTQQLRQWLIQARSALDQAYGIQAHLNSQSETLGRDNLTQLEGLVKSWEALYSSVIGSREEILNLSEDQLQTLLSPLNYLPARGSYGALEQKLERLQQHLQSTPLKIKLIYSFEAEDGIDKEASILSVIYQIDTLLDRVSQAETMVPSAVAMLGSQRNSLARQIPAEFPFDTQIIFQKIDDRIQLAQKAIERGRWMLALDACDSAQQGLEGSAVLVEAATAWAGTNQVLEQYRFEGYRISNMIPAFRAAEQAQAQVGGLIGSGQLRDLPIAAVAWSRAVRTLREEAQSLVSVHKSNLDTLQKIKAAVAALDNRWQVLSRSIHRGDRDLNAAYSQIENLKTNRIPAIEHLNSLEVQDFRSAQTLLAETEDALQIARKSVMVLERRFDNNSDYDTYGTSDPYSKRRPPVVYTNTSSNTAWKRRQGSGYSSSQRPANTDWKRNTESSRPSPPPTRSSGSSSSGGSSSRGSGSGGGSSSRSSSGGGSSRRR